MLVAQVRSDNELSFRFIRPRPSKLTTRNDLCYTGVRQSMEELGIEWPKRAATIWVSMYTTPSVNRTRVVILPPGPGHDYPILVARQDGDDYHMTSSGMDEALNRLCRKRKVFYLQVDYTV